MPIWSGVGSGNRAEVNKHHRRRGRKQGNSMANLINRLPITCPKCGHEFTKTVAGLKREPKFSCPKCGQQFDGAGFLPGVQKIEKSVEDLKRKIRDISKKRRP
jgi:transcription initiation factor IIE alpha subunit